MDGVGVSIKSKNKRETESFIVKLDNLANMISGVHGVSCGWLENRMHKMRPDGDGLPKQTPISLPKVAFLMEYGCKENRLFGTDKIAPIPPRPFMRPLIDKEKNNWKRLIFALIKSEIKKGASGNIDRAFDALGLKVVGDIKSSIEDVTSPALSALTVKFRMKTRGVSKDKFSKMTDEEKGQMLKPLEDTGELKRAVSHRVYHK